MQLRRGAVFQAVRLKASRGSIPATSIITPNSLPSLVLFYAYCRYTTCESIVEPPSSSRPTIDIGSPASIARAHGLSPSSTSRPPQWPLVLRRSLRCHLYIAPMIPPQSCLLTASAGTCHRFPPRHPLRCSLSQLPYTPRGCDICACAATELDMFKMCQPR